MFKYMCLFIGAEDEGGKLPIKDNSRT